MGGSPPATSAPKRRTAPSPRQAAIASGKLASRPELDRALLSANRTGDQLVVTKLDRLGRHLMTRFLPTPLIAAAVCVAGAAGLSTGIAHADKAGEGYSVWHATSVDDHGRTLWCNHRMTGDHYLVWQGSGPSDIPRLTLDAASS